MAKANKPLFPTQGKWAAGLSDYPVFIDGLSTTLFYLIVAAKNNADNYQAVVVGKWGEDEYKIKMYGTFEDWGFTQSSIAENFRGNYFRSRTGADDAGYERYITDTEGVIAIMNALSQTRNVTVCPPDKLEAAFHTTILERKAIALALHPIRGGGRPQIPFSPPQVITHNAA